MTETISAPAWEAAWLNGWLAAVGLSLRSGCRLHWEGNPNPIPVFSSPAGALSVEELAEAIPSLDELSRVSIARKHPDLTHEFDRNPKATAWAERARHAREHSDRTLGATMSDQLPPGATDFAHSAFDASVPKGITVAQRVVSCREKVERPVSGLVKSMLGALPRVKQNGLGFDARRIVVSTAPGSEKYVDPVVEVLAFAALELVPVRGDGRSEPRAKGFVSGKSARGSFTWPVWSQPLDTPAVDALLDRFWSLRTDRGHSIDAWASEAARFGITGAYAVVPFRAATSSDPTRGFASEVIWMT